jgi:hypothetical protein
MFSLLVSTIIIIIFDKHYINSLQKFTYFNYKYKARTVHY